jgi:hypothetical protein
VREYYVGANHKWKEVTKGEKKKAIDQVKTESQLNLNWILIERRSLRMKLKLRVKS